MKSTLLILVSIVVFYACDNKPEISDVIIESDIVSNEYNDEEYKAKYNHFSQLDESAQDTLMVNIASFIIRKPAAATWETKFNPEFRMYYTKNASELSMIYLTQQQDTFYYYLMRDARTAEGVQKRGVGGKYLVDEKGNISNFEEVFVTKVLPELRLQEIGGEYLDLINSNAELTGFIAKTEFIEWPDGRLFYSKEKKEWRYVD